MEWGKGFRCLFFNSQTSTIPHMNQWWPTSLLTVVCGNFVGLVLLRLYTKWTHFVYLPIVSRVASLIQVYSMPVKLLLETYWYRTITVRYQTGTYWVGCALSFIITFLLLHRCAIPWSTCSCSQPVAVSNNASYHKISQRRQLISLCVKILIQKCLVRCSSGPSDV